MLLKMVNFPFFDGSRVVDASQNYVSRHIMRFSIIIPVYNEEEHISFCLDSILSQEYDNYEVIVVNDGSTDGTRLICDSYAKLHPNHVKPIHIQNSGAYRARRVGIEQAIGEYICFVDSDDAISKDYFSSLETILILHSPEIILFGFYKVDEEYEFLSKRLPPLHEGLYQKKQLHSIKQLVVDMQLNSLWSKCIKTKLIDSSSEKQFDQLILAEDFVQILSIFDKAESVYVLHKPLYHYRQVEGSLTLSQLTIEKFKGLYIAHQERMNYATKWNITPSNRASWGGTIANTLFVDFISKRFTQNSYSKKDRQKLIKDIKNKYTKDIEEAPIPKQLSLEKMYLSILKSESLFITELFIFVGAIVLNMRRKRNKIRESTHNIKNEHS